MTTDAENKIKERRKRRMQENHGRQARQISMAENEVKEQDETAAHDHKDSGGLNCSSERCV